jgi:hypothetical protein
LQLVVVVVTLLLLELVVVVVALVGWKITLGVEALLIKKQQRWGQHILMIA